MIYEASNYMEGIAPKIVGGGAFAPKILGGAHALFAPPLNTPLQAMETFPIQGFCSEQWQPFG